MKANQSFRNADEAVSPVIGVILMVAITVILAVVVFALVSRLSNQDSSSKPKVTTSSEDDQAGGGLVTILKVANAPAGGLAWAQITFTGSANCGAAVNPGNVGTPTQQGTIVTGGDSFGCSDPGGWNMIYTPAGTTDGVVVAKGQFPTA